MESKKFEVISVLGPLGAGKTTTLNRLIEHVPLDDSYAVVVNDVGENNVDARRIWDHPANRSEKIIPLTAGCIGCSDVTQFKDALERVHDSGINVLFIEPTGIAPGTEIANVVRSSGFDLSVIALANAQTVERDLKWQVLPSQLSVADIIGITHIPDSSNDADVMNTVLDQLPPLADDVSVELIKPNSTDFFEILAKLRGMDRELRFGRHLLEVCECDCGHKHGHDHAHNHGVSAKSFRLKQDINISDIENILMPLTANDANPLLRAKGTVGGIRFDLVGSEWNTQESAASEQSTMNVIFGGRIPQTFSNDISKMIEPIERVEVSGDKKSIVKSISDLSIAERSAIVHERTSQYPSPISISHGELIPDCEADEGYEIAFWGNHDDMPDDIKKLAMNKYISFRLAGLHELQHHPEAIANADSKRSYWMRRYGATLGYNGYYLANFIDEDSLAKLREHNPARLLAQGLLELDELTFDGGRAEEKPEFVNAVLKQAIVNEHISPREVTELGAHMLKLSEANPSFHERWTKALHSLELKS